MTVKEIQVAMAKREATFLRAKFERRRDIMEKNKDAVSVEELEEAEFNYDMAVLKVQLVELDTDE